MVIRPLRSFLPRRILLLAAASIIAIVGLGIGIRTLTAVHPHLSRQQAIAAVVGANRTPGTYPRAEAKYMHRTDADRAIGSHLTTPDTYVWVVAVSGDWGPRGEQQQGAVKSALAV
ncbi:MAG TPA: hypothetical protein VLS53_05730, partial [Candidatus Dormibacteraeota bacterium]|nr:hypothetical protein [Candidatus Dormibacteraeota bacterium]